VDLTRANITGEIDMRGASFDAKLNAVSLLVSGDLLMASNDKHTASYKDVDLTRANITGLIEMSGASFDCGLEASFLRVGQYLSMSGAKFALSVNMQDSYVGSNLDLHGATLVSQSLGRDGCRRVAVPTG
jgi:hypothetical protein